MRLAARVDENQKQIVGYFRKFGCSVLHLHTVGKGCPDILVSHRKQTALVEIKDGKKCASARALTQDEQKFHQEWQGKIFVVNDLSDVIEAVRDLEGKNE